MIRVKVMICGKKQHAFISRWQQGFSIWQPLCLVSKSPSQFPGLILGTKVSLVGLLITVVVGVEAAGRVVLAGLCTPLRWRFHQPGQEWGEESRGKWAKRRQTSPLGFLFLCWNLSPRVSHVCNLATFLRRRSFFVSFTSWSCNGWCCSPWVGCTHVPSVVWWMRWLGLGAQTNLEITKNY